MNKDRLKEKIYQIGGMARKAWGALTGDGTAKAEESMDEVPGVSLERIEDTKEVMRTKRDRVYARLHRTTGLMGQRYAVRSKMRSATCATLYPIFIPQGKSRCCG
jgi:uncharacterized protein YjbJ (UPF0337 family)